MVDIIVGLIGVILIVYLFITVLQAGMVLTR